MSTGGETVTDITAMPAKCDATLQSVLESQDVPTGRGAAGIGGRSAAFHKRLSAWQRSTRWLDYDKALAFCRKLEEWLTQVERELLPSDPVGALELAEAFIESDRPFFERADDSDGGVPSALFARPFTPADEAGIQQLAETR